jgi:uncharacterized protein
MRGDESQLVALLRRGPSATARSSALLSTARDGRIEMVRALLEAGADPNWRWSEQTEPTPLMEAAWCGRPEVVRLLLRYGADPGLRNTHGETALMLAQRRHHRQVAAVLAEWPHHGPAKE